MSDAGAHLRGASDYVTDALNEVSLAREATSDDDVEAMVEEVAADLESIIYAIGVTADEAEADTEGDSG